MRPIDQVFGLIVLVLSKFLKVMWLILVIYIYIYIYECVNCLCHFVQGDLCLKPMKLHNSKFRVIWLTYLLAILLFPISLLRLQTTNISSSFPTIVEIFEGCGAHFIKQSFVFLVFFIRETFRFKFLLPL